MDDTISIKDTADKADRMFRRALAIFLAIGVFVVGSVFISGWFGEDKVQDNWVWAILAAGATLLTFYAAQKDNRDFRSGRISAIITSTLKDYAVTGLGIFVVAALMSVFGIAPFSIIIGAGAASLLAQFAFNRTWVPLK